MRALVFRVVGRGGRTPRGRVRRINARAVSVAHAVHGLDGRTHRLGNGDQGRQHRPSQVRLCALRIQGDGPAAEALPIQRNQNQRANTQRPQVQVIVRRENTRLSVMRRFGHDEHVRKARNFLQARASKTFTNSPAGRRQAADRDACDL